MRRFMLRLPAPAAPAPHGTARPRLRAWLAPAGLGLLLLLLGASSAAAQSVRWDPPGGQLGFNQVSQLSLTFEDCEPELDTLRLPAVDGLVVGQPSQSSSTQIVNFKMSRQFALVFPVRPTKRAPIQIPAFSIKTDKGSLPVATARFTVGDATVGSSGLALDDISSARLTLPKTTLWAGEVVPVTYTLSVVKRYFHSLASGVDWPAPPLVLEEWSKPEPSEIMLRGERRLVVTQATRAYAKSPGIFSLSPATQLANLVVGSTGFGFFTTPSVEQRAFSTEPIEITVKPLPAALAGFSGAIGQFTLVSKVVPTAPAVGEPVTWTLELSGTGNWPDLPGLPAREVSNDFQVVQPQSKRKMKDNSLFEGTLAEDVVLVPTKPGSYTLGGLRLTYFDTRSGTYKTLTTEPVTITVGQAAAAAATPAPSGPVQFSLSPSGAAAAAPVLPTAVPPTPPENLPRKPIAKPASGAIPFTSGPLVLCCLLAAGLGPLLLWLALAAARSRQFDPARSRRAARTTLARTLAGLRTATGPAAPFLRQWQEATATLWAIPHAAPGSPLVATTVGRLSPEAAATWTTLWSEADRALHGPDATLPADWLPRAEAALAAARIPAWPVVSLFAPRHLFPFLAPAVNSSPGGLRSGLQPVVLALVGLLGLAALPPQASGAAAAHQAYRQGDFAAAEQHWQKALAADPADWTLRHNLGLALAQQDRWAEATARWTGAFLLQPRADVTRWDLALGLQRSGLAPPELVDFSHGQGRYALARLASPAEWQAVLLTASLLLAGAAMLLLLRGYGRINGWARPTALGTILLAIVLAGAATFSLRTYGRLADPAAVMVWRTTLLRSIPTEAETTQKISPLSAGSLAVADRPFFGWRHLTFPGGQTGWVRGEDLVSLYR